MQKVKVVDARRVWDMCSRELNVLDNKNLAVLVTISSLRSRIA